MLFLQLRLIREDHLVLPTLCRRSIARLVQGNPASHLSFELLCETALSEDSVNLAEIS